MTTSNYLYQYPYYGNGTEETVTTVTETFYDDEGRVTKEVVTETRKTTKPYYYPSYQPYVVGTGGTISSTGYKGYTINDSE